MSYNAEASTVAHAPNVMDGKGDEADEEVEEEEEADEEEVNCDGCGMSVWISYTIWCRLCERYYCLPCGHGRGFVNPVFQRGSSSCVACVALSADRMIKVCQAYYDGTPYDRATVAAALGRAREAVKRL